MRMLLVASLIACAAAVSISANQEPLRFDKTIEVARDARLRLDASAGRLILGVWDKSAVRVVAAPLRGTQIGVDASPALLSIRGRAPRGGVDEATYEVTMPRGMGLVVEAGDMAIEIGGTDGDIAIRNQSGRIAVRTGRGSASLTSVMGEIVVEGWTGKLVARTVHAPVRLSSVTGDLDVETSTNHLYLSRINSKMLSASTVGGGIWFDGTFDAGGRYDFAAHSGSVILAVAEPVNATLMISTVNGAFSSEFPHTRQEGTRRGSFTVRVGSGAAAVDIQTFSGAIALKRRIASDAMIGASGLLPPTGSTYPISR